MKKIIIALFLVVSIFAKDDDYKEGFKAGFYSSQNSFLNDFNTQGINQEIVYFDEYISYIDLANISSSDTLLISDLIRNRGYSPILISYHLENQKKEILVISSYRKEVDSEETNEIINSLLNNSDSIQAKTMKNNKKIIYRKSLFINYQLVKTIQNVVDKKDKKKVFSDKKLLKNIEQKENKIKALQLRLDKLTKKLKEQDEIIKSDVKLISQIDDYENAMHIFTYATNLNIQMLQYNSEDFKDLDDKFFKINKEIEYLPSATVFFYRKVQSKQGTNYYQLSKAPSAVDIDNFFIKIDTYFLNLIKKEAVVDQKFDYSQKEFDYE